MSGAWLCEMYRDHHVQVLKWLPVFFRLCQLSMRLYWYRHPVWFVRSSLDTLPTVAMAIKVYRCGTSLSLLSSSEGVISCPSCMYDENECVVTRHP
jgi:hypothetical protein